MPSIAVSDPLALAFKAGKTGKTPNNGRVLRFDGAGIFYAQLHNNTIARRDNSTLELCHCGYVTARTAARLGSIIRAFGIHGKIVREGGAMFFIDPRNPEEMREVPDSFGNLSFNISGK